jgi:hypothetical protein
MPKVNMRDRDIGIQKIKEFIKNRPRNKMGGGRIYKANGGDVPKRLKTDLRKEAIRKEMRRYGGPPKPGLGIEGRMERYRKKMEQKRLRKTMMGGGMMKMPRAMYKKGGIAKGCGAVMSDRRKVTKVF